MVEKFDERITLNVFTRPSTYLNDYKIPPRTKDVKHYNYADCERVITNPPPDDYIDNETHYPLRSGVNVPFDLLWEVKPIIRTCPYESITETKEPPDEGKENAIATRPRTNSGDAIPIDDLCPSEKRDQWVDYIYNTTIQMMNKDVQWNICPKPLQSLSSFSRVKVKSEETDIHFDLPPQFRDLGVEWENRQKRAAVDPTAQFWINYKPIDSTICKDPGGGLLSKEQRDELQQLIKDDKLAMPYDYLKPGYGGTSPTYIDSIPWRKNELSQYHPLHSVNELVQSRYDLRNQDLNIK